MFAGSGLFAVLLLFTLVSSGFCTVKNISEIPAKDARAATIRFMSGKLGVGSYE